MITAHTAVTMFAIVLTEIDSTRNDLTPVVAFATGMR
jgi:hypothetical protein